MLITTRDETLLRRFDQTMASLPTLPPDEQVAALAGLFRSLAGTGGADQTHIAAPARDKLEG